MEIFVDADIAPQVGREATEVAEMERQKVDFIVSVGGDGTILRTIHKMADPVPILGINMGTLGFLVDVEPKRRSRDPEASDPRIRCRCALPAQTALEWSMPAPSHQ